MGPTPRALAYERADAFGAVFGGGRGGGVDRDAIHEDALRAEVRSVLGALMDAHARDGWVHGAENPFASAVFAGAYDATVTVYADSSPSTRALLQWSDQEVAERLHGTAPEPARAAAGNLLRGACRSIVLREQLSADELDRLRRPVLAVLAGAGLSHPALACR